MAPRSAAATFFPVFVLLLHLFGAFSFVSVVGGRPLETSRPKGGGGGRYITYPVVSRPPYNPPVYNVPGGRPYHRCTRVYRCSAGGEGPSVPPPPPAHKP